MAAERTPESMEDNVEPSERIMELVEAQQSKATETVGALQDLFFLVRGIIMYLDECQKTKNEGQPCG